MKKYILKSILLNIDPACDWNGDTHWTAWVIDTERYGVEFELCAEKNKFMPKEIKVFNTKLDAQIFGKWLQGTCYHNADLDLGYRNYAVDNTLVVEVEEEVTYIVEKHYLATLPSTKGLW